ncbi:hypothetical protein HY990_02925 [Candidatus Micrarchaeota archaeon]|nr:hypothetical protein [Candidatus Micrarchaeota archaeon]
MSAYKVDFLRATMRDRIKPQFPDAPLETPVQFQKATEAMFALKEFQRLRNPRYGVSMSAALTVLGLKPLGLMEICRCSTTEVNHVVLDNVGPENYFAPLLEKSSVFEAAGLKLRLRKEVGKNAKDLPCHSGLEIYDPNRSSVILSSMLGSTVSPSDVSEALGQISYGQFGSHLLLGYPEYLTRGGNGKIQTVHFNPDESFYAASVFGVFDISKHTASLEARAVAATLVLEMLEASLSVSAQVLAIEGDLNAAHQIKRNSDKPGDWSEIAVPMRAPERGFFDGFLAVLNDLF